MISAEYGNSLMGKRFNSVSIRDMEFGESDMKYLLSLCNDESQRLKRFDFSSNKVVNDAMEPLTD